MIQIQRGAAQTTLACRACGGTSLSAAEKKIRVLLGKAVWMLHARCADCGASSRWNWPRSVQIEEVDGSGGK